jgi:FkbM family methyltransferase
VLRIGLASLAKVAGIDLVRVGGVRHSIGRRARLVAALGIDLVIDVGAHEGEFGVELRSGGYRGAILSIEPLAGPFRRLSRLAAADGQWEAISSAAGSRSGSAVMHVAANAGASSSILPMLNLHAQAAPQALYVAEERVTMATLDDLAISRLPQLARLFIKADVQGYELEVLSGGAQTLAKASLVQLEMSLLPLYAGAPTYVEVLDFMANANFRLAGIEPGMAAQSGLLLQADGLFVSDEASQSLLGPSVATRSDDPSAALPGRP